MNLNIIHFLTTTVLEIKKHPEIGILCILFVSLSSSFPLSPSHPSISLPPLYLPPSHPSISLPHTPLSPSLTPLYLPPSPLSPSLTPLYLPPSHPSISLPHTPLSPSLTPLYLPPTHVLSLSFSLPPLSLILKKHSSVISAMGQRLVACYYIQFGPLASALNNDPAVKN